MEILFKSQFGKGLKEVVAGILFGVLFNAELSLFQQNGVIPPDYIVWFTIAGALGSIITIFSFKTTGVVFTVGWILGAWLLKDLMDTNGFLVYFWAPVIALALRAIVLVKKTTVRKW